MITASERVNTIHALDRSVTVTGIIFFNQQLILHYERMNEYHKIYLNAKLERRNTTSAEDSHYKCNTYTISYNLKIFIGSAQLKNKECKP
jgi:hypothetical protein